MSLRVWSASFWGIPVCVCVCVFRGGGGGTSRSLFEFLRVFWVLHFLRPSPRLGHVDHTQGGAPVGKYFGGDSPVPKPLPHPTAPGPASRLTHCVLLEPEKAELVVGADLEEGVWVVHGFDPVAEVGDPVEVHHLRLLMLFSESRPDRRSQVDARVHVTAPHVDGNSREELVDVFMRVANR